MDSSGYIRPSTSEHPQRRQDPGRIVYEDRTPRGRVEQGGVLVRAYERFFELPVALVIAAMWVVGVALSGSCALGLLLLGSLLLQVLN